MGRKRKDIPYDIILDSIADGVFTVDSAWNITSFNRAAERITGVSCDQAVGKKCFDVFRADICQGACVLRRTMETGKEVVDQRISILSSDGRDVPISISTAVLQDQTGEFAGGVETFRDLTAMEMLRQAVHGRYRSGDIISKNHEIQKILNILPDIAQSDSTVLIEGPSGSGKELFARAVHDLSQRKRGKFVAVNCGALPDTLLESELFGYVRGAFTDAKRDKPGRFAVAQKGTILLDEIGDVSTALQVKLLRVLQEKEYEPLGATGPVKANVRVIAATNKPLLELVARGLFRDDLYYRLNVVKIAIPPLARRKEDIPLLIEHFVSKLNARTGMAIQGVAGPVSDVLMRYDFPGNVRELENILEYAFILCREREIQLSHLPADFLHTVDQRRRAFEEPGKGLLQDAEIEKIVEVLQRYDGNRSRAAAALGIHKTTLWRKMKQYGIGPHPPYSTS